MSTTTQILILEEEKQQFHAASWDSWRHLLRMVVNGLLHSVFILYQPLSKNTPKKIGRKFNRMSVIYPDFETT